MLSDNEIIKALECCGKDNGMNDCKICPNFKNFLACKEKLSKLALDLINHLQAENEQLKNTNPTVVAKQTENINIAHIKAEAYKEFAERLERSYPECKIIGFADFCYIIDNLLKELVGEVNVS